MQVPRRSWIGRSGCCSKIVPNRRSPMDLTSPQGYDKALALRLAEACKLAYDLFADPTVLPPAGYQLSSTFAGSVFVQAKMLGYKMISTPDVVVAFRGT